MVVDCQIGIHPHEKAGPQAITVDVTLGLAASLAAQNDDILTTVDYDQVWNGVHELVKARPYNLQETLCAAIAELCLAHLVGNYVEQAYARSELLERRRELLNLWTQFVLGETGKIIQLGR